LAAITVAANVSKLHQARNNPATPPNKASNKLSVSNCRITRQRLAPRHRRTPISRCRDAARANSRLARLEQAINNTMPVALSTIPKVRHAPRLTLPPTFPNPDIEVTLTESIALPKFGQTTIGSLKVDRPQS